EPRAKRTVRICGPGSPLTRGRTERESFWPKLITPWSQRHAAIAANAIYTTIATIHDDCHRNRSRSPGRVRIIVRFGGKADTPQRPWDAYGPKPTSDGFAWSAYAAVRLHPTLDGRDIGTS